MRERLSHTRRFELIERKDFINDGLFIRARLAACESGVHDGAFVEKESVEA